MERLFRIWKLRNPGNFLIFGRSPNFRTESERKFGSLDHPTGIRKFGRAKIYNFAKMFRKLINLIKTLHRRTRTDDQQPNFRTQQPKIRKPKFRAPNFRWPSENSGAASESSEISSHTGTPDRLRCLRCAALPCLALCCPARPAVPGCPAVPRSALQCLAVPPGLIL